MNIPQIKIQDNIDGDNAKRINKMWEDLEILFFTE